MSHYGAEIQATVGKRSISLAALVEPLQVKTHLIG